MKSVLWTRKSGEMFPIGRMMKVAMANILHVGRL